MATWALLLDAVDAERPDVVVTDVRMPPGDADEGIQAAERLRETHPDIGVVVLSQYANASYVLALLDGGRRRAYLLKERVKDLEQLASAIRTVADGGSVIDPKVVEELVANNTRGEDSPLAELTPRERDVLREMAEGKTNAAIAEALFLTERSVEKVIHSIFLKLGLTWETAVHKRVKAVILYLGASVQRHRESGSDPMIRPHAVGLRHDRQLAAERFDPVTHSAELGHGVARGRIGASELRRDL